MFFFEKLEEKKNGIWSTKWSHKRGGWLMEWRVHPKENWSSESWEPTWSTVRFQRWTGDMKRARCSGGFTPAGFPQSQKKWYQRLIPVQILSDRTYDPEIVSYTQCKLCWTPTSPNMVCPTFDTSTRRKELRWFWAGCSMYGKSWLSSAYQLVMIHGRDIILGPGRYASNLSKDNSKMAIPSQCSKSALAPIQTP